MATPGEKLAESLEKLKELQDNGIVGIKTDDLSRLHRERLLANGFIREVMRGWFIIAPHDERKGDSTSWFTSFWGFCANYLNDRFGEDYCISAEQSILIHAGNHAVPHQLIIRSTNGNNSPTNLLFNTSLFVMKSTLPEKAEIELKDGIRLLTLASAVINCPPALYQSHPTDIRTALLLIRDSSELLEPLLDGGHSVVAGRIVGAYRNLGQNRMADDILKTMQFIGYDVRELDPFKAVTVSEIAGGIKASDFLRDKSPYVNRIRLMWCEMRNEVIEVFPKMEGKALNTTDYLKRMEELFISDAYHSLSIEKYQVNPELIARVRSGSWQGLDNEFDRQQRDAMAARGYWQAFKAVKESVEKIVDGENAGSTADSDHGEWYRQLFAPSVNVGILKASDLAGYRNNQVYIGSSKHTPINKDGVRDVMPLLFELLQNEQHAGVRAVLGHFVFVYIHPYMDGNGRMGRFLMNVMLASGAYPWTVIPVEERDRYMAALESASVDQDIKPFAEFIGWLVKESMEGRPVAGIG